MPNTEMDLRIDAAYIAGNLLSRSNETDPRKLARRTTVLAQHLVEYLRTGEVTPLSSPQDQAAGNSVANANGAKKDLGRQRHSHH